MFDHSLPYDPMLMKMRRHWKKLKNLKFHNSLNNFGCPSLEIWMNFWGVNRLRTFRGDVVYGPILTTMKKNVKKSKKV